MKRVIFLVPDDLEFSSLTAGQQMAINAVFGQYVMPVPATKSVDGLVLLDAIADNAFDPSKMQELGLNWEIVGMWQKTGDSQQELIAPLVIKIEARQDKIPTKYDDNMNPTEFRDATLADFHNWVGWNTI